MKRLRHIIILKLDGKLMQVHIIFVMNLCLYLEEAYLELAAIVLILISRLSTIVILQVRETHIQQDRAIQNIILDMRLI
nr:MAG TPA: hypothetical protein [Caudoviricetes sp.]